MTRSAIKSRNLEGNETKPLNVPEHPIPANPNLFDRIKRNLVLWLAYGNTAWATERKRQSYIDSPLRVKIL